MDVELFWILEDIASAEALVARNGSGVNTIADLKGKKIATPFVSTSHFQLAATRCSKAGLKPTDVQILNMRPPEIARRVGARRHRRDVHLGSGAVDGQEERQGADDVGRDLQAGRVHVRRPGRLEQVRGKDNPDFMVALVKAIAKADADYRGNREGLDRRRGQGRSGRQVVGRQARGRRRRDGALRLPEPGGPGVARVAGRRRRRRRGEGARATGELPARSKAGCSRSRRTTASP